MEDRQSADEKYPILKIFRQNSQMCVTFRMGFTVLINMFCIFQFSVFHVHFSCCLFLLRFLSGVLFMPCLEFVI